MTLSLGNFFHDLILIMYFYLFFIYDLILFYYLFLLYFTFYFYFYLNCLPLLYEFSY